ncbi:adenosylmethionine decarboxylase proenzyme [Pseudomonas sp. SJZ085]|jgi:S-adenosylmethionine decarboxylase|uniref:S-adenosylmethionine decarboxylase proenzyme n=1 Tax=Pseudomonas mediterranea TaxID=183795 RepID=A0AAX2D7V4_9PSED|nr:adenosylmethionine decarboxylase proenzyme [Pseudomonas sp. SJZ075]TWC14714.1 adenosylmethionine decarboxylase proenzyme [Pseudomonas sp. SJZ074]TWC27887.1 adenosylmethionine decarboxylase proenzyme [Pseudomonas sp. SJZ078]TWC33150.1 adenosylmethionine decarboxylase proenzyme [Pseudomonas sp. SJZ085]TWC47183.1 adenosylmethionine decarboxylase proenzyme [Pseudomonas sp. SJZ124]TWC82790.1 adenosylmethionine decarboxylase proenzyme [Pseudomonas sp. SJZ101]CAH0250653.1 S-adenosylmethionine dec
MRRSHLTGMLDHAAGPQYTESFQTVKSKLKLHGFNNLTKTLSFNIYDICYAETPQDQQAYVEYINKEYNAKRLTQILTEVVDIIGANILNIASQDYEPQGASVTILISEEPVTPTDSQIEESPGPLPEIILAHLDKSHITVHTYPEIHPVDGIATFRVDIDVSTCGVISPLKALNFLIHQFDSDIVTVDYRVRGFTRDVEGHKHFIDHEINSIQNYLSEDTRDAYQMTDVNVYQENLFHTKMLLKDFELDNYLFGDATSNLSAEQRDQVEERVKHEMLEIFYARNMPR